MIGGLAIVAIAVAIGFVILRKRRKQREYEEEEKRESSQLAPQYPSLTPHYQHHVTSNESFRAGNGSERAPPSPHSDTTAGFAGIGASGAGALQASNPTAYASSASSAYVTDAYESTAMVPSSTTTSKAREAALNRTYLYAPSVTTASHVDSQTGSLLSPESSQAHSISPTEVLGLRAEVENLRRVMQEIRAERLEPPPEYMEG